MRRTVIKIQNSDACLRRDKDTFESPESEPTAGPTAQPSGSAAARRFTHGVPITARAALSDGSAAKAAAATQDTRISRREGAGAAVAAAVAAAAVAASSVTRRRHIR